MPYKHRECFCKVTVFHANKLSLMFHKVLSMYHFTKYYTKKGCPNMSSLLLYLILYYCTSKYSNSTGVAPTIGFFVPGTRSCT